MATCSSCVSSVKTRRQRQNSIWRRHHAGSPCSVVQADHAHPCVRVSLEGGPVPLGGVLQDVDRLKRASTRSGEKPNVHRKIRSPGLLSPRASRPQICCSGGRCAVTRADTCFCSFFQSSRPVSSSTTRRSAAMPGSSTARSCRLLLTLASPRWSIENVQSASKMEGSHDALILLSSVQHCASPSRRDNAPATVSRPASRSCVHSGASFLTLNANDGLLISSTSNSLDTT